MVHYGSEAHITSEYMQKLTMDTIISHGLIGGILHKFDVITTSATRYVFLYGGKSSESQNMTFPYDS